MDACNYRQRKDSHQKQLVGQCLTCLLLAGDRNTCVGTAYTNGILSLDPEAVSLAFLQVSDVSVDVADCLKSDPVRLAFFLVFYDKASDFTSACAIGPLPLQPHLCLVCICVVQVFGWARRV